jgi:ATP-dependent Clp protease ATP-binding subunit ClpB
MADTPAPNAPFNFLIRGSEYLDRVPDFKLVGRDKELKNLTGILMRKNANNVMLVGPGGTGLSALCMGLQASKNQPDTPLDMINKRFYWLDTDALFASGDVKLITDGFERAIKTLTDEPNTVLIINDTKAFMDGARNNGCTNFVNSLMSAIEKPKFQAIFESSEADADSIAKMHSDITDHFTRMRLEEPTPEDLKLIVNAVLGSLENFHGIKASPEAAAVAIDVTTKYRTEESSLSRAQPERALTLIDRAFTAYRQNAHAKPHGLGALETLLTEVNAAITNGTFTAELNGRTPEELETIKVAAESDIAEVKQNWESLQAEIKSLYDKQRDAEKFLVTLQNQYDVELKEQADRAANIDKAYQEKQAKAAESAAAAKPEGAAPVPAPSARKSFFSGIVAKGGAMDQGDNNPDSPKTTVQKIEIVKADLAVLTDKYNKIMADINAPLQLKAEHVLAEFSTLSGISVSKLTQDEKEKIKKLNATLTSRVYDQDAPLKAIADAIRVSRTGLGEPTEPEGAFMLLGPPGCGKTETALALAEALYDTDKALVRLDMAGYSEKNDVKKIIGCPPGYEGYEQGGDLTNIVLKNPRRVILLDEFDKGHVDTYDVLLSVLSAGRLPDNHGRIADFTQSFIIMTANIGSKHFLNPDLTEDEAREEAMKEIRATFRPEFIDRFAGGKNIMCYRKLQAPTIVKIATRNISKLNTRLEAMGLQLYMEPDQIAELVKYKSPGHSARGIAGFFKTDIKPILANTILDTPGAKGVMKMHMHPETHELIVDAPIPAIEIEKPSNQNVILPASAAFNQSLKQG